MSLDGINGRSIQTLLRGENDSKQSDEFQATSFCLFVFWGEEKRERPGDYGKGNEMNIGYIQSSSQIRRHLEIYYRAEQSAPDPIGLNPLVSLWSLQNIVFFITSTLHLDEILLSKC